MLRGVVQPLGLNVRRVKSLSNTLKLYLDIAEYEDEARARRLAAFLFADMVDPGWLDGLYHKKPSKDGDIGQLPDLANRLEKMIDASPEELTTLYRMIGRRPRRKRALRVGA